MKTPHRFPALRMPEANSASVKSGVGSCMPKFDFIRRFPASKLVALVALVALGMVGSQTAQAVTSTWTGGLSGGSMGLWSAPGNWQGSLVAGTTSLNNDTAIFASSGNGHTTVTIGNIYVGGVRFASSAAAAYTLNSGTLNLASSGYAGGAGLITMLGPVINSETIAAPIFLQSTGTSTFNNDSTTSTANLIISGSVNMGTCILALTGSNTGNNIVSGGIGAAAPQAIIKSGVGTWTISGTNSYSNLTVGVSGTNGGLLIMTGNNVSSGTTTIASGTLQVGNGGTLDAWSAGRIIDSGGLVFNLSNSLTVSSLISGVGSLTMNGSGNVALTATNTISGAITINSGTLSIGSGALAINNPFGAGATVNLGGGALNLNGGGFSNVINVTANSQIATVTGRNPGLSSAFYGSAGTTLNLNIANNSILKFSGSLTNFGGTFALANSGTLSLESSATDGGNATFDLGSGNLSMNFAASNTVNLGALQGASGSKIGNRSSVAMTGNYSIGNLNQISVFDGTITDGTTSNVLTQITVAGGTLILTGTNNSYSAGTVIDGGATLQLGNGGATGQAGASNSSITNNGGLVFKGNDSASNSNNISGTGSLTQQGTGVLTLTGSNSYSGATNIKSGKIIVSSSLMASGTVTVGDSASLATVATLGGSGVVGNVIALGSGDRLTSGATIDPGNSAGVAGILTMNSLSLTNGAHLSLQIGGLTAGGETTTGHDQVVVNGALTLTGGSLELSLLGTPNFSALDVIYLVINNSGSSDLSSFDSVTLDGGKQTDLNNINLNGQQFGLVYNANYGGIGSDGVANDIALMAVPEPATWLSLLGGFGFLLFAKRIRRATRG